ncbi:MAG: hypothetical protein ACPL1F_00985 [bacterium]|jgi:glycosyltransferase involved in cell wall biosynthesis
MDIKYFSLPIQDIFLKDDIYGETISLRNYFKYSKLNFIPDFDNPDLIIDCINFNFWFKHNYNKKPVILKPLFNIFQNIFDFNYITKLVFTCNKEKEVFFQKYQVDIPYEIIPIFFDPMEFEMDFYNIPKEKPSIFMTGRLRSENKNILKTLEILKQQKDYEVWVKGDIYIPGFRNFTNKPILEYLENRFETLNLIYNSDIIIIPSKTESFGRLVVEGLKFNKKIIATPGVNAIWEFPELFDKEIFVIKEDLSDLLDVLKKIDLNKKYPVNIDRYFDLSLVEEMDNLIIEEVIKKNV